MDDFSFVEKESTVEEAVISSRLNKTDGNG